MLEEIRAPLYIFVASLQTAQQLRLIERADAPVQRARRVVGLALSFEPLHLSLRSKPLNSLA